MDRGFDIPLVGVKNTMDRRFNIPSVGGQNTMGVRFDISGVGVKVPCIGRSKYHGYGN